VAAAAQEAKKSPEGVPGADGAKAATGSTDNWPCAGRSSWVEELASAEQWSAVEELGPGRATLPLVEDLGCGGRAGL